ncbi:RagB/SusD family nutrient uptake outer membrane protein [Olivibacter sp. CPCC 100613]|uniref:RagB/SusD family nutrient uptake outer membrane protein n=1 Tax=Olivibacter sp. CPCC 100613 TaxID=3079931 RepID=UPI002FF76535
MKVIHRLVYSALLLSAASSCKKDFLDEDTSGFLSPDNSYTTTAGFEAGLNGLYAYARLEFQTWNNDLFSQGATPQEALQVGTDIVTTKSNGPDGSLIPFAQYTLDNASSYVRNYWRFAYGLIGNANSIIYALDHHDIVWDDPANDPNRVRATALFFRAYGYRYLINLYGDVPWVEEISSDPRTDFTRTPRAEVVQHMIDDLKYASANLPENPDAIEDGKLTKWAALHYLAEDYLVARKPDSAIIAAKQVVESGYYTLNRERFGAEKDQGGDVFHDLFIEHNQNRKSGNRETIWAIQLEYNTQGGGDLYTDWSKRAWVPFYANVGGFTLADSLGGRGLGQIRPFDWWLNSYETTDIRNSEYNIKRNWYYNDPTSALYGQKVTITQQMINSGNLFPTTTKFFYGKTADNPAFEGNMKDRVKIRLAETYLLLAEAYLQQNNLPAAAQAVNEVRSRANASIVSPSAMNVDYLLDERARELIGEEMRRITLSRFGQQVFLDRVRTLNEQSRSLIQDYHVLWPIPQEVIDANSGAEFPQNPGYN